MSVDSSGSDSSHSNQSESQGFETLVGLRDDIQQMIVKGLKVEDNVKKVLLDEGNPS